MPTKPKTHRTPSGYNAKAAYDRRRKATPALAQAKNFRSSKAWQDCRAAFVVSHPLCCDPLRLHQGRYVATQQVHHITPLQDGTDEGLSFDNLAPLCTACHAKIEARERQGQRTAGLFAAFQARRQAEGVDVPRVPAKVEVEETP